MTPADEQLQHYLVQIAAMMHRSRPNAEGYVSIQDFVFDRGVQIKSEPLTEAELATLMRAVETAAMDGEGFEQKQCFANAARIVLADPSFELEYWEGIAQGSVIPCPHAWVCINGKVVDLTWRLREGETRALPEDHEFHDRIVGVIPEGRAYRGIGFDREYLYERVSDTGYYMSLIDDYKAGWPLLKEPRRSPPPELPPIPEMP